MRKLMKEASQEALVVKNLPANAGDIRLGFNPWVGKILWRRAWQPTPGFLPGESHGQGRLVDYSQWGRTELGMTEATQCTHTVKKNSEDESYQVRWKKKQMLTSKPCPWITY